MQQAAELDILTQGQILASAAVSLQRGKTPANECPVYDAKNARAPVMGNVEYPFIAITRRSILAWRSSTWKDPIYGSNRTDWHINWEQTNDLC